MFFFHAKYSNIKYSENIICLPLQSMCMILCLKKFNFCVWKKNILQKYTHHKKS